MLKYKITDSLIVVVQICTRVQMFFRNEITLLFVNTMLFLCCNFSQGHISKADVLSFRLTQGWKSFLLYNTVAVLQRDFRHDANSKSNVSLKYAENPRHRSRN